MIAGADLMKLSQKTCTNGKLVFSYYQRTITMEHVLQEDVKVVKDQCLHTYTLLLRSNLVLFQATPAHGTLNGGRDPT